MLLNYQGGWELDETIEQAAMRETMEEAGVLGHVAVSVCKYISLDLGSCISEYALIHKQVSNFYALHVIAG